MGGSHMAAEANAMLVLVDQALLVGVSGFDLVMEREDLVVCEAGLFEFLGWAAQLGWQ